MTDIQVPDEEKDSFVALFNLDEERFGQLIAMTSDLKVGTPPSKVESILMDITNIPNDISEVFIKVLYSIGSRDGDVIDPYVSDFYEIYRTHIGNNVTTSISEDDFKKRLTRIYANSRPIRLTNKIFDSKTQFGNYLVGQDIQCDIKPVKLYDSEEYHFVPSFSLKLLYKNVDNDKEDASSISIVIDRNDVTLLRNLLERAENTYSSLESQLKKGGANFIDIEY